MVDRVKGEIVYTAETDAFAQLPCGNERIYRCLVSINDIFLSYAEAFHGFVWYFCFSCIERGLFSDIDTKLQHFWANEIDDFFSGIFWFHLPNVS